MRGLQAAVSRLERGVLGGTTFAVLERVAVGLGAELDVRVRWRGEELDRLLDGVHASVVERVVGILVPLGWRCASETTFLIRGERGSVDVLAWHPPTGRVLVIETKSVVPDMQQMLSSLDRKVRLAGVIAAGRGWRANGVARAIVLPGTATNRRRVERFGSTLRTVLPNDGPEMRRWLADPAGSCPAALWFLSDIQVMTASRRRRIRPRKNAVVRAGGAGYSSVEAVSRGQRSVGGASAFPGERIVVTR